MTFTSNSSMMDFLVLSVIAEGDAYGYQISQIIKRAIPSKDSTPVPCAQTAPGKTGMWKLMISSIRGRNRRYYRITPNGRQRQQELVKEWETFKFIIDDIVKGGISDDQK